MSSFHLHNVLKVLFMLQCGSEFSSFLKLNEISIQLLMDTCVTPTFWLPWTMVLWLLTYTYVFKSRLSILLDIYTKMWNSWITRKFYFNFFLEIIILPSIDAITFYILVNTIQGFQFLYILPTTLFSYFFCYFSLISLLSQRMFYIWFWVKRILPEKSVRLYFYLLLWTSWTQVLHIRQDCWFISSDVLIRINVHRKSTFN